MSNLCEYCWCVDFTELQYRSFHELKELQNSSTNEESSTPSDSLGKWSLGLHSRVETSAASCSLCHAICELLRQNRHIHKSCQSRNIELGELICVLTILPGPRTHSSTETDAQRFELRYASLFWCPRTDKNSGPGSIEDIGDGSLTLFECFWASTPGCLDDDPPLAFLEDQDLALDNLVYSGRRRPGLLNSTLPRLWLTECLNNHNECGTSSKYELSNESNIQAFRLIDVNSNAIQEFPDANLSSLEYAALSYVWGGPQSLTLENSTIQSMKDPGFFESASIPATLKDAIDFTRSMSISYLWVDALCIIQDCPEDKAAQLGRLHEIYSQALFTIAVCDGDNADAGLPGVSVPRTAPQVEVTLPRAPDRPPSNLLASLTPRREQGLSIIDVTKWSSRAWTLQEFALSARVVFFMDQQIFWLCGCATWSEEIALESRDSVMHLRSFHDAPSFDYLDPTISLKPDSDSQESSKSNFIDDNTWRILNLLVRSYQMRNLTHPGDALDAFTGILNEVSNRTGVSFLWGLDTSMFEFSLCWGPLEICPPSRRDCLTTREMTSLKRQVPFPSWSWIGWEGMTYLTRRESKKDVPKITCYVIRNSPLRLVQPSPQESCNTQPIQIEDIRANIPDISFEELQDIPDNQYLCFWAECLWFNDEGSVRLQDISHLPSDLQFFPGTGSSFLISELYTPEADNELDTELVDRLEPFIGSQPEIGKRIMVDAETQKPIGYMQPCPWHDDKGGFGLVLITETSTKKAVVLEVQRKDGVCWRRSIGSLEYSVWARSGATRSLIVLS